MVYQLNIASAASMTFGQSHLLECICTFRRTRWLDEFSSKKIVELSFCRKFVKLSSEKMEGAKTKLTYQKTPTAHDFLLPADLLAWTK